MSLRAADESQPVETTKLRQRRESKARHKSSGLRKPLQIIWLAATSRRSRRQGRFPLSSPRSGGSPLQENLCHGLSEQVGA